MKHIIAEKQNISEAANTEKGKYMQNVNIIEIWTEPLGEIAKLYMIYLYFLASISIMRNVQIISQIYSFKRKRESMDSNIAERIDLFIKLALKGRVEASPKVLVSDDGTKLLFSVDCIETRFAYLWNEIYRKVQATKSLAILTIIITACLAWLGLIGILSTSPIKPDDAYMLAYLRDLSWRLCPGLWLCAFLYGTSLWHEGTLASRKNEWNYAKVKFKEKIRSIATI
jgi:hypothetical protein